MEAECRGHRLKALSTAGFQRFLILDEGLLLAERGAAKLAMHNSYVVRDGDSPSYSQIRDRVSALEFVVNRVTRNVNASNLEYRRPLEVLYCDG